MKGTLVVLVLLLAVVVAFAVQNPVVVTVRFFHLSGPTHLLVVIVVAFAAGLLAGWIAGLPMYFRRRSEMSTARKRIQLLDIEVAALKEKIPPPTTPAPGGKA